MKKTLFILLLSILAMGTLSAQGLETFANYTATGSTYTSGSFTGQDGSSWTYTKCRGDVAITGKALMIGRNQSPQSECFSGNITGGVGTLSFSYMQAFMTAVNLNVLVNGIVVGNVTATGQTNVVLNSGDIVVNVSGDFVLKFKNVNNGDGQVVIDNITWSGYAGSGNPTTSTPIITPLSGDYYNAFSATINCSTENSTIYYTVDGSDPDDSDTAYNGPVNISSNTTLKAIAYAQGYDPSNIASAIYVFPPVTNVSDISTMRAGAIGTLYRLTGEAILTFQQNLSYHPKWVQDATAAMYIYDTAGKITTSYNMGDGITGLIGTLALYNNLLEFVPVADPGVATSTGNVIVPEPRTLASLTSADQSKLVLISNVTLDTTLGNFPASASNINATDPTATRVMRTLVSTDYIGTPIPSTPQDITCLVGEYTTGMQISPRFLADFAETYDYPAGQPIVVGDETITVTGGNANNSGAPVPPVNNAAFVAAGSYSLTLIGAGPWTITIETDAPWGAYYKNGQWYSVQNVGGFITFVLFANKDILVPIVLGDVDPTLPVELSSFTATITTDLCVKIAWVAQSETNHSGYNILRAENTDLTTALKINPSLIDNGTPLGTQLSYSYTDQEAYSNMLYYYWLESIALDGASEFYGPLSVTIGDPSQDPLPPVIPIATKLMTAFPNPFNPNTNIRYSLKEAGKVNIDIYNVKGQLVRSFIAEHANPGYYQVSWDGKDNSGNPAASGIYMYRMTSGKYSDAKKMILAK